MVEICSSHQESRVHLATKDNLDLVISKQKGTIPFSLPSENVTIAWSSLKCPLLTTADSLAPYAAIICPAPGRLNWHCRCPERTKWQERFTSLLLREALTCRMAFKGRREGTVSAEVTSLGWQARTGTGEREAGGTDRCYIRTEEGGTKLGVGVPCSLDINSHRGASHLGVCAHCLASPSGYHLRCQGEDPSVSLH